MLQVYTTHYRISSFGMYPVSTRICTQFHSSNRSYFSRSNYPADIDLHPECKDWNTPEHHDHEVHEVLNWSYSLAYANKRIESSYRLTVGRRSRPIGVLSRVFWMYIESRVCIRFWGFLPPTVIVSPSTKSRGRALDLAQQIQAENMSLVDSGFVLVPISAQLPVLVTASTETVVP